MLWIERFLEIKTSNTLRMICAGFLRKLRLGKELSNIFRFYLLKLQRTQHRVDFAVM